MKKQMKLLLFALLALLMVATLAVCVSAAETTKDAANAYYQVETDAGNKYYSTLAEAITNVKASGTITVLKNVSEAHSQTIEAAKTYTIKGQAAGVTITFNAAGTGTHCLSFTAGDITFENITLKNQTASASDILYTTAHGVTFTLKSGTKIENSRWGIWCYRNTTVNIYDGASVSGARNALRAQSSTKCVFNIYGGTLTSTEAGTSGTTYGTIESQGNTTLNITGGTITNTGSNGHAIYFYARYKTTDDSTWNTMTSAKANISGATLKANTPIYIATKDQKASVCNMTVTNTVLSGPNMVKISTMDFSKCSLAISNSTFKLTADAGVDGLLNSYATHTDISLVAEGKVTCTIDSALTTTISTKADANALILDAVKDQYRSVSIREDLWNSIVINHADSVVTLAGEALDQQLMISPFISVTAGTLDVPSLDVYFFKTTVGGVEKVFLSLTDAIAAVENGGIIYMTDNVTMGAPSFNVDKTFTIDGAGFTLTLTPVNYTGTDYNYPTLINIKKGDVTLKNMTLKAAEGTTPSNLAYIMNDSGKGVGGSKLTIEDVVSEVTNTYGFWVYQAATLVIKGEKTSISGCKTNMFRVQSGAKNAVVSIEAGTFSSSISTTNIFEVIAPGASVTINGGTFHSFGNIVKMTAASTESSMATVTVKGGVFHYIGTAMTSDNSYLFGSTNAYNKIIFPAGGTAVVNGGKYAKALICTNSSSASSVVEIMSGSFDGGQCWIFSNQAVTYTIGGTAKFTDTNNYLKTPIGASYPGAIALTAGSLTINGGSFVMHKDNNTNPFVSSQGSTAVTVTNLTLTMSENSKQPVFLTRAGSLTINGGSFDAERIVALDKGSTSAKATKLTINGGVYTVRGDKAIVLTNLYNVDYPKTDEIVMNGATVVLGDDAVAFIYGSINYLAKLQLDHTTVFTPNEHTALYGQLMQNDIFIFNASVPCKMIPAGTVAKFGGKIYNVYYTSGSTNADLDVSNSDDTYKGASVHVGSNASVSGIRFYTVLSAAAINAIKALSYDKIEFGTLIAPIDYVVKAGGFTIEKLAALTGIKGAKYEKIPAVYSVRDADGDGIPESYSAALVNLKTVNFTRGFAAISYVEIDGVVYYGSFNSAENARSIRDVAKQIIAAGSYNEGQLQALVTFAGFNPTTGAVSTNFTAGKISANSTVVAADGYVYSDLIHLEKAGTVVTFTGAADANTLVISQYDKDGNALSYADNYKGDDKAVAYTYGDTTTYSYVSSFDNEYIRVSYKTAAPAVYTATSYAGGTLKNDLARYNAYMLSKLANAGGYYDNLEKLDVVAIGDSYFNDPAVIPNMWIDQLARKYDINLYNYGISGSTMANDSTNPSKPMVLRVKGAAQAQSGTGITIKIPQTPDPDVDVVFLEGGRNDLSKSASLGEISLNNKDEATMCGAINVMIEHLRYLYPNAMIVGMSCWGYNVKYTVNTTEGNVSMSQKDFSRQIYEIYLMNGIVAFDSSDIELSGVDVNSAYFREHYTKGFGDISHLNALGAAMFLPRIEKFVAEAYAEYKKG